MAKGQIKQKQDTINQQTFENLCHIQCTEVEICSVLNVSDTTLSRWCKETYGMNFEDIHRIKREGGKMSLRRKQWNMADNNPTMAIWLGKQYLGQRDYKDYVVTQKVDQETIDTVEDFINGADTETEESDK